MIDFDEARKIADDLLADGNNLRLSALARAYILMHAELQKEREVLHYEKIRYAAMFEHAVRRLTRIKSFVHSDGFVLNGKGYSFNPPIELVREAWEALSKAIREIDVNDFGASHKGEK